MPCILGYLSSPKPTSCYRGLKIVVSCIWSNFIFISSGEVKVLVTQSCPTLCDPMDGSPPGSSVHEILQARILAGVAIPSPGDLSNPGIKHRSPPLQADSVLSESPGKP